MQTCITSGGCMSRRPNNGLSWATITLPGSLPQTPSGSPCSGTACSQHSTRSSAPSPSKFSHSQRPCEGLKACITLTSVAGPLALLSRPLHCDLGPNTPSVHPSPRPPYLLLYQARSVWPVISSPKPVPTLTLFYLFFVALNPSQGTQLFTYCVYSELSVFHPPLESKSCKAEISVWVFTNEHSINIC